jgi:hypothetical protein
MVRITYLSVSGSSSIETRVNYDALLYEAVDPLSTAMDLFRESVTPTDSAKGEHTSFKLTLKSRRGTSIIKLRLHVFRICKTNWGFVYQPKVPYLPPAQEEVHPDDTVDEYGKRFRAVVNSIAMSAKTISEKLCLISGSWCHNQHRAMRR